MYSPYLRTKYSYMILTYNRLNFKQKHTREGKKSDPTDMLATVYPSNLQDVSVVCQWLCLSLMYVKQCWTFLFHTYL